MQKLKQIIFAGILGLTFINPVFVLAQVDANVPQKPSVSTDNVEYTGVDASISQFLCTPDNAPDGHGLEKCINKMYRFGVSFGALALVFFFVFAGYSYIVGGETGKDKAKGIFKNSLVGMGIMLGSFVLLKFINPNLVVFKPIQPPIFDAADLPTCEEVGLGEACKSDSGQASTGTATAGATGPSAHSCPSGLVAIGSEIPTSGSANSGSQICKNLRDKLIILVNNTKNSSSPWARKWGVRSSPMGAGHQSHCHSFGTPESGTCVDLGFGPIEGSPGFIQGHPEPLSDSRADRYYWLCTEITKAGGMIIHNEAAASGSTCGGYNGHSWATNWHIHTTLGAS